jgi:hypothetical protein
MTWETIPPPELSMAKPTLRTICCLAVLTLATPSALRLEAGNLPLSRKGLVMGVTLAGGALLATHQVMQHGPAHHPVAKAKPHNGIQPLPAVEAPTDPAATNRTDRVDLNLTLPVPVATAAGAPREEAKAEPATQGEAARLDALVLAAQKVFPESLCPGELPHTLRARSAHREHRHREPWGQEQTDAWYRQNAQELASRDEVRNYRERVGTALATLHNSACLVLRKYRESGRTSKQKRSRLRDGVLNLRRLQAQFLDEEREYNKKVSIAFWFAKEQAELGHSAWEEAPGSLPYKARLEVCDAEWDRMEAFAQSLMDTMAPILVEMMPGNTTERGKDHRRWRFNLGW